jgi:uncharacterized protein
VGCRGKRPARELLRLACTPQGEVLLDRSGHLPGRGVYVCFGAACLRQAIKPSRLAAALRQPVAVPLLETLYQSAVCLLYDRLGSCLGMAQKAGAVVSGATLLQQALAHNRVHYVVLAEDIAASRAEEYRSRCIQLGIPWTTLFSKVELGQFLGKPSRSAIGLSEPRFCQLLQTNVDLLKRLRSSMEGSEAPLGWSKQSSC